MLNSTLSSERQQCWETLRAAGVVTNELPPEDASETSVETSIHQAWYIRVMLGFSGWLGALFLVGFVGIGFEFVLKHALLSLSLGGAVCAVAYVILSVKQSNDFMQQFGLAVSMAGQGLVLIGLFKGLDDHISLIALAMLVFEVGLLIVMPNLIHRFLSGLGAVWALCYWLDSQGIGQLARGLIALLICVVWWSSVWYRYQKIARPLAFALSFALLCFEVSSVMNPLAMLVAHRVSAPSPYVVWIGTSLLNVALLGSTLLVLQREAIALSHRLAKFSIAAMALVAVSAYFMPGFAAALLLLMIAFAHGSRILTGISVLAMLGFLARFYYQLQMDLLDKSIVLAICALSLFALRSVMQRLFPTTTMEQDHV